MLFEDVKLLNFEINESIDYKKNIDLLGKGISTGNYKKIQNIKDLPKKDQEKINEKIKLEISKAKEKNNGNLNPSEAREIKKEIKTNYLNMYNTYISKDSYQTRTLYKDNDKLHHFFNDGKMEEINGVNISTRNYISKINKIKKILSVYFPGQNVSSKKYNNKNSILYGREKYNRWDEDSEKKFKNFYNNTLLGTTSNSDIKDKIARDATLSHYNNSTRFPKRYTDNAINKYFKEIDKISELSKEQKIANIIDKLQKDLSHPKSFPSIGAKDFPSKENAYYNKNNSNFRKMVETLLIPNNNKVTPDSNLDLNDKITRDVLMYNLNNDYKNKDSIYTHVAGTENEDAEQKHRLQEGNVIKLTDFYSNLYNYYKGGKKKLDSFYIILNTGVVEPVSFDGYSINHDSASRTTKGIDGLGYNSKNKKVYFVENKGSNNPRNYVSDGNSYNTLSEVKKFVRNCSRIGVVPVWNYSSSITATNSDEEKTTNDWKSFLKDIEEDCKKNNIEAYFLQRMEMNNLFKKMKMPSVKIDKEIENINKISNENKKNEIEKKYFNNLAKTRPEFKDINSVEQLRKKVTSLLRTFLNNDKVGGLFIQSSKKFKNKNFI